MKRPIIIIDCSTISKGGGLQVLISTIEPLIKNKTKFIYKFIIPKSLYNYLPKSIKYNKNTYWVNKKNIFEKIILIFNLYFISIKIRPKLIYTLFGPQYFKPFSLHIVGFAKPSLIYPKIKENNFFSKNIKDLISRYIFKVSDYFIVETKTVKKHLAKVLKVRKNKIYVLKNSVNIKLLEISRKKIINEDKKITKILVPSAYYPHKNLESLIPIAFNLCNSINNFEFLLTINDEIFNKYFYSHIKNTKIQNNIKNIGPQKISDLANYYLNSNIIFLPTLLECSTAVYPEAFYFEVPLVTSNLDFAKELCGDAALFCDPKDPMDCANKITNLIKDLDLQRNLTFNGKKQLKTYLKNQERKTNLEDIFQEIIYS